MYIAILSIIILIHIVILCAILFGTNLFLDFICFYSENIY